ncbi:MAG: hypothetical protein IJ427_01420 [Lachnospiraceae bacterium]|nr:hypothetical protein [Lachnospiraceae bacterium]
MKKRFVKVVSLIAIVSMMLMGLAACGKTECFFCGEKKSCKTYDNALLGEIDVCKDCKSELEDIKSGIEDIFN